MKMTIYHNQNLGHFLCLIQVTIIAVSQVKLDIIIIINNIQHTCNTPAHYRLSTAEHTQSIKISAHTHTNTTKYIIVSEFLDQRDGLAVTVATVLPGPNNPSNGHTHQYHNQRHTRHHSNGNPRDLPEAPPTVPVTLALVVVAVWERLGIQPSILGLHGLQQRLSLTGVEVGMSLEGVCVCECVCVCVCVCVC